MLWYKSWLETRWRFYIGLAILICMATMIVASHPLIMKMMPAAPRFEGRLGEMVESALSLISDYRGYAWSQWFGKNLLNAWTVFAVLLGIGGLTRESANASALFTLSLPVSRRRQAAVRFATGAVELALLALVPSLFIPLLSPSVGQSYSLADTLVHSLFLVLGGMAVYAGATLLSALMADQWRPLLIALGAAAILGLLGTIFPAVARYSVFRVMSAESYFFQGQAPWLGAAASLAAAAAMWYGAARVVERRDF